MPYLEKRPDGYGKIYRHSPDIPFLSMSWSYNVSNPNADAEVGGPRSVLRASIVKHGTVSSLIPSGCFLRAVVDLYAFVRTGREFLHETSEEAE